MSLSSLLIAFIKGQDAAGNMKKYVDLKSIMWNTKVSNHAVLLNRETNIVLKTTAFVTQGPRDQLQIPRFLGMHDTGVPGAHSIFHNDIKYPGAQCIGPSVKITAPKENIDNTIQFYKKGETHPVALDVKKKLNAVNFDVNSVNTITLDINKIENSIQYYYPGQPEKVIYGTKNPIHEFNRVILNTKYENLLETKTLDRMTDICALYENNALYVPKPLYNAAKKVEGVLNNSLESENLSKETVTEYKEVILWSRRVQSFLQKYIKE
jgi:hypothetical protein